MTFSLPLPTSLLKLPIVSQRFAMLDKDQDGVLTEDDVMSVPADVVDEAFGQTPPGEVKTRIMIH